MYPIIIQVSNDAESIAKRSFRHIGEKTVIQFLIDRLKTECCSDLIIATSNLPCDDIYEKIACDNKIKIYRGSSNKCLTRLSNAMKLSDADGFIRVFAKNPLLDISNMKEMYFAHQNGGYEYSYNEHTSGIMIGTGCDIFSRVLVDKLVSLNLKTSQEETVGFYIRQNSDKYKILRFIRDDYIGSYPYRVSIEIEKDIEVVNDIVSNICTISNDIVGQYLEKHPVLAEYNKEAPAKEVGLDKFYMHTEKVAAVMQDTMDCSYPISVELTLTNRCNLKCIYCSDQMLRERQGGGSELSKETLFRLFDDLSEGGTQGITIEGGGEPTIYPDFGEVVCYARKRGLAVGLITNGTQRLDSDIVEKLEWIRVSLDATTAEEYQKLKGADLFETVLNNIFHYSHHCSMVGVGFVVTNNNVAYIEELVMRLRELGASYIQLRPVVDNPQLYPHGMDFSYLKYFESSDFGVIIDGMTENAEKGNHCLPCYANSVTSVISGDGSVYLCGRLNIYNWVKPIGNINEYSFSEIWNGEERKRQWGIVQSGIFCRDNCPQCRVSKLNVAVDRMKKIKSKHFI